MVTKKDKVPKDVDRDECFDVAKKLLDDPASILDNIMMSMGDGLSIHDLNMRIVYQNKFMIDNFGSHIGDYCYNVYEKRSSKCKGCPMIKAFRNGQVTKALRVGITKDGLPFRFENIASVLRNENGKIVAGIELCRIVEEREKAFDDLRETMKKLKKTQEQLVRSEKLAGIGHLAAGVAHEINNPTAFILSNMSTLRNYLSNFFNYIDSMEKIVTSSEHDGSESQIIHKEIRDIINSNDYRYLKDDLPEVVEESLYGLQRIKSIVSSLLTFASSNEMERNPVDINSEIESALLMLGSQVGNKGTIEKKYGDLPETFANSNLLIQMFTNLILNAIQAIKEDGVIAIKTKVKRNLINISISDNGVGIPADDLPNIFNPFFTTREVGSGVGLGLSIAYRIVESHNGTIAVQSEPGHGTKFTIKLPIISLNDI